jgi:hypothetical protein
MVPHSIEAEEAFLGSILINPELLDDLPDISPDDFFIVRNAWVWEAIVRLTNRGDEIDYVTVVDELRRRGRLEEIGGAAYVTYLLNNTPSSLYAHTYGAIVERASYRRHALSTASDIAQLAHEETLDAPEVQARIDAAVEALYDRLPKEQVYLQGRDAVDPVDPGLQRLEAAQHAVVLGGAEAEVAQSFGSDNGGIKPPVLVRIRHQQDVVADMLSHRCDPVDIVVEFRTAHFHFQGAIACIDLAACFLAKAFDREIEPAGVGVVDG